MITTNNKNFYLKARDYRNLCFGKKDRFNHSDIAWNYRMTNISFFKSIKKNKFNYQKDILLKTYYSFLKKNKNIYIQNLKKFQKYILGNSSNNNKQKIKS